MARPFKQIDQDEFEKLCGLQCTVEEICGWFGVTDKTLYTWAERTYGRHYSEVYEEKRGVGKISLRRAQFRLAEKNAAMAIFLGKNYLGQRDHVEIEDSTALSKLDELLARTKDDAIQSKTD